MFDTPQPSRPSGSAGSVGKVLAWAGAVLLVVGALMAGPSLAPYIASRLHRVPPTRATDPPPVVASATPALASPPSAVLLPFSEGVEVESTPPLPLPWPSTPTPIPAGYPPTRIVILSIEVDAPVQITGWEAVDIDGTVQSVWAVLEAHLAGWHEGSAPLGLAGNTVINGHNWPEDAVFRNLYQVEPGDRVVLYSDELVFSYEVTEALRLLEAGQPLEVRQANARYIQPTGDERVTLVTCHPYGGLTYRLVVVAKPTEFVQPEARVP
jgi:sortase A